jgi:type VI protein secretion system component VasF
MRNGIGNIVRSIIRQGLSLRDRLEAGEALDPAKEQAALIDMFAPLAHEEAWDAEEQDLDLADPRNREIRARLSEATIRYALAAWLDAFLVRYSLWGSTWYVHSLEAALYGNATHGKKFWQEARYAETRKDLDALEVLYWCVMLGFRGEGRELSEPTGVWASRIRTLLEVADRAASVPTIDETVVQPMASVTDLPYRRMVFAMLMTGALAIPAASWLVWQLVS